MLVRNILLPLFLFTFTVAASVSVANAVELKITQITPTGENVPAGNQILISFNQDLVPLGSMERRDDEIPVSIKPALNCQWRWLTLNSLACQLDQDKALTLATQYQVTVNTAALNAKGDALAARYQHRFKTSLPKIVNSNFHSITERGKPVTGLHFNQAVTKRSAKRVLRYEFSENGKTKAIGVTLLAKPGYARAPINNTESSKKIKHSEYWQVQPKKALPKNTEVKLVVAAGLATPHGNLLGEKVATIKKFHTFGDFEFIGITCANTSYESVSYFLDELDRAKCNPDGGINLDFSTPLNPHQLHGVLELRQNGEASDALTKAWAEDSHWPQIYDYHEKGQYYPVALPLTFKPKRAFELSSVTQDDEFKLPKDVMGQTLANIIQAPFKTRHFSPSFNTPKQEVVLESQVNSDFSIAVTNIDSLEFTYEMINGLGSISEQSNLLIEPGFDKDISAVIPLGVRQMLGSQSGIISGYFTSPEILPNGGYTYKATAQVTPYHVHAKIGHFSSLVWVSDLATGKLISNAKVEVVRADNSLASKGLKVLDSALTDDNGLVNLKGLSEIDSENTRSHWCNNSSSCTRLFVRVKKGNNLALLPIQHSYQVNSGSNNQVYSQTQLKFGHVRAWGTTAQGLYRQGDTIQYKLYVRGQDLNGLTAAPAGKYKLEVQDQTGKVVHEKEELELSEYGALSGEVKLADNAAMGWYQFILHSDYSQEERYAIRVLVTDFTPSPFRLSQQTNGDLFLPGQSLVVNAQASLHSGGAFTGAETAFEIQAARSPFSSDNPVSKQFNFTDHSADYNQRWQVEELLEQTVALDAAGQAEVTLTLPTLDPQFTSAELRIKTGVKDDRGKSMFQSTSARYLGVDRLVGLRSNQWVYKSGKDATLDYLVVDKLGTPVTGTNVNIAIAKRETIRNKIDGSGSGYQPSYQETWVDKANCEGSSNSRVSSCSFKPESAGVYRFTASIDDTQGRPHSASQQIWVTGEGLVTWQGPNSNALEIVAEKDDFSVGDTARFLIKNPYPGAQAIVTIERYGILDSWQQTLEGSAPVIEFDIKPNYLPGAFLSVLVTVPRTGTDIPVAGQPDLNKPTYRLGYQQLTVSDPDKAIKVDIKSDAESYKPGDIVTLTIKPEIVNAKTGDDVELAVSVLDEAVFDLVVGGLDYFDPYAGFNKLEGLDVENYSLLTKLVGLQKFSEKKVESTDKDRPISLRDKRVAFHADSIRMSKLSADAPMASSGMIEEVIVSGVRQGSDESLNPAALEPRDKLQDSAHWEDQVIVNDDGSVTIKFKLPDNLTAWRVLALATTPTDRLGLGDYSFKVNQFTEIRPVMPNQVMESDTFNAGFSVHNRSAEARTLTVTIEPGGDTLTSDAFKQTIELAAHARETVFLPMSASRLQQGVPKGLINYVVKAYDQTDGDALKHALPVNKRRNLSSAAVYGSTVGELVEQAITFPIDIAADLGGLNVSLSPTIISSVDGAFEYMRGYPYACWEQKLTKAVMASHYQTLKPYLGDALTWPESVDLPQTTLDKAMGHQADNGGMAYFVPSEEYVSPYLSAYTALAFTWLTDAGFAVPELVQEKLHEYLNQLLRNDIFPEHFSNGMKATVRAVALSALAKNGDLSQSGVLGYLGQSQEMSLFGKAQLLSALSYFDNTEAEQRELIDQLLANSNSSASKVGFNDATDSNYARILSSPMRTSCAILSSLSSSPELLVDKDLPSKLAQTIVANRQGRSHWENTQDNVFCMNALGQYAKVYEAQKPMLSAQIKLGDEEFGDAQFNDYKDPRERATLPMRADLIGQDRSMTIEHTGEGRVYYQTLLQYSENQDPIKRENSGIDLRRELSVFRDQKWQLLSGTDTVARGELLRTDLFVSVPADRGFVAVRDPVAGGLEPINSDLATSGTSLKVEQLNAPAAGSYVHSQLDWQRFSYSPWGFYHQELGHDSVTFYADYLVKGQYHLSYFSQAIASGEFTRQPAHAEEMYHPDVYGKSAAGTLLVIESLDKKALDGKAFEGNTKTSQSAD